MKRYFRLSIIFLLAFCVSVYANQPKLKIEGGDTYDWGKVKDKDSPLKAKIKILNVGDKDLKIENVRPGCGCTTAPLDKTLIPPGDFATMDVTLNITNNLGTIQKSITITSNDSTNSPKLITLKATVTSPIAFNPNRYLSFGQTYVGKESKQSLILTNTTDEKIVIMKILVTPPNLKLNVKEGDVIPPKGQIQLDALYTPDKPGNFQASVTIDTSNPDMKQFMISGWGVADAEKPKDSHQGELVPPSHK
ncbi:MAG: DUF1573 domain-containing protein [FCB group bacterium]|jgi:hypothetical protein